MDPVLFPPATANLSVLIVDDEPVLREMLRELLSGPSRMVAAVENAREALRELNRPGSHFDVVMTDILMPDCDGFELIRQLKRERPGLPVIAMSAGGQVARNKYLTMALRLGADGALAKPFSGDEFEIVLRELLR